MNQLKENIVEIILDYSKQLKSKWLVLSHQQILKIEREDRIELFKQNNLNNREKSHAHGEISILDQFQQVNTIGREFKNKIVMHNIFENIF